MSVSLDSLLRIGFWFISLFWQSFKAVSIFVSFFVSISFSTFMLVFLSLGLCVDIFSSFIIKSLTVFLEIVQGELHFFVGFSSFIPVFLSSLCFCSVSHKISFDWRFSISLAFFSCKIQINIKSIWTLSHLDLIQRYLCQI